MGRAVRFKSDPSTTVCWPPNAREEDLQNRCCGQGQKSTEAVPEGRNHGIVDRDGLQVTAAIRDRFRKLQLAAKSCMGIDVHLKAGMAGLAIMMASKWKRPSATNTMASVSGSTTGAVQPSTFNIAVAPLLTSKPRFVAESMSSDCCACNIYHFMDTMPIKREAAPSNEKGKVSTSPGDSGRACGTRSDGKSPANCCRAACDRERQVLPPST